MRDLIRAIVGNISNMAGEAYADKDNSFNPDGFFRTHSPKLSLGGASNSVSGAARSWDAR